MNNAMNWDKKKKQRPSKIKRRNIKYGTSHEKKRLASAEVAVTPSNIERESNFIWMQATRRYE